MTPIQSGDTFTVRDIRELQEVVGALLQKHPSPAIFRLLGEMGAGKTTFVHALCDHLELKFQGSPTFSLVHEYTSNDGQTLYHFDLYRVKTVDEAREFGIHEYLEKPAYVFIEWPQVIDPILPLETITISIEDLGGIRRITF